MKKKIMCMILLVFYVNLAAAQEVLFKSELDKLKVFDDSHLDTSKASLENFRKAIRYPNRWISVVNRNITHPIKGGMYLQNEHQSLMLMYRNGNMIFSNNGVVSSIKNYPTLNLRLIFLTTLSCLLIFLFTQLSRIKNRSPSKSHCINICIHIIFVLAVLVVPSVWVNPLFMLLTFCVLGITGLLIPNINTIIVSLITQLVVLGYISFGIDRGIYLIAIVLGCILGVSIFTFIENINMRNNYFFKLQSESV